MLSSLWRRFARWRRSRPVAAGAFTLSAGIVVAVPPYASFRLGDAMVSIRTVGGVSALVIGTLLVVCGLSLWLRPRYRVPAAVTTLLLSLVALSATNLGGFLVGTLLGLIGAALAFAWTDQPRPPRRPRRHRLGRGVAVLVAGVLGAHTPAAAGYGSPPARSWTLVAESIEADGVVYHGVDRLVVDGRPSRTMWFTMRSMRMTGPALRGGRTIAIEAPRGAAAGVDMHVLRLTGDLQLLGLLPIPVDFTPDHPPPLVPPSFVMTGVTTVNALVRGEALTLPGARFTAR
ncbi:DUF6114 domain-containing protein [Actinophytocola sp.]|uniref:DUF6114 domain-containing protein n=1 Tax=Actinophytocola sp. TaxID=1872138 RepID=UPI00389A9E44